MPTHQRMSDDEASGPSPRLLQQTIDQNFETSEAAHKRLRNDYRSLEGRLIAIETAQVANAQHFATLETAMSRPVEISSLRFTPAMVLGIVAICGSSLGAGYVIDARSSARYDALSVKYDAATAKMDADRVLLSERVVYLTEVLKAVQAQQKLTDLNVGHLSETLAVMRGK